MRRKFTSLLFFGGIVIVFLIVQLQKSNFYINERVTLDNGESSETSQTTQLPGRSDNILQLIMSHNQNQRILNTEKFGPITAEHVFITIQVHNRISYLNQLIESLRASRHISKALLIISHDVYDEAINQVISSQIDFCLVIQIFYPYSIQTHPLTFPGDDPNDCPRDATKEEVKELKCNNLDHPDKYGHYREAKFTQMKHHWWWKLNQIFDHLDATRNWNGYLLLLEEDYFVADDFIHVMNLLEKGLMTHCNDCNIISLGTYTQHVNHKSYNIVDIIPWITSQHNMGMMFNRTTWNAIRSCHKYFCHYDDYNYDWSLQNVNYECLDHKLLTAMIRGPRVYHIGECGVHHLTKNCDANDRVYDVKSSLSLARKRFHLYPKALVRGRNYLSEPRDEMNANGGWGDLRDQNLCSNMTLRNE